MAGWEAWACQTLTRNGVKVSDRGGIFGFDGSCWSGTDEQVKSLPPDFFKKAEVAISQGAGKCAKLVIGDKKYMIIRNEPDKYCFAKSGGAGLTVAKAKQCYIVGVFDGDDCQANNNSAQIQELRDTLADSGF